MGLKPEPSFWFGSGSFKRHFEWWNWSPFYIFKVRLFKVLYYAFEANKEWKLRPEPISGFQKPEADKIIFGSSTARVTLDINIKLNGPMYRIVYIERQMGSFSYCCVYPGIHCPPCTMKKSFFLKLSLDKEDKFTFIKL